MAADQRSAVALKAQLQGIDMDLTRVRTKLRWVAMRFALGDVVGIDDAMTADTAGSPVGIDWSEHPFKEYAAVIETVIEVLHLAGRTSAGMHRLQLFRQFRPANGFDTPDGWQRRCG